MRVTASSSRAIGMVPSFTWASRLCHSGFQLSGAIYMSSPALIACGQLWLVQPATWPCAFQRSEEHTSELQSLMRISYAVFCLKKKNTQHLHTTHNKTTH